MPKLTPLVHRGDSANIAYYGERGDFPERIWVDVLESSIKMVDGEIRAVPSEYHFAVHRQGDPYNSPVAEFVYRPKTKRSGRLPTQTVTRLVKKELER